MGVNNQLTLYTSAARTATSNSGDIDNIEAFESAIIVIDVTAVTSTPSTVFTVQGKDILSGVYYTILASTAIATISTTILHIGDGTAAAANSAVGTRLPRVWRLLATHGNANSMTFTAAADLLGE